MRTQKSQNGFTLIELIVTITVAAIVLAIAAPSFIGTIDKGRVKGAAETVYEVIQAARAESIKQNETMFITLVKVTDDTTWCIGINDAAACNCETTPAGCDVVVDDSGFRDVELVTPAGQIASPGSSASFDPLRGTLTVGALGNLRFESSRGRQVELQLQTLGRTRICAPAGNIMDTRGEYPQC